MQGKQRVVIIGAGFGGLSAALEFADMMKKAPDTNFEVTVIDKNEYQLYTPDLYEIASGNATIEDSVELKNTVCIDVKLALRALRVQFFVATVESVDRAAKKIHTTNGVVVYDYLIVAPGSVSFDYHIPGVSEYTTKLKTAEDALEIREQLLRRATDGQSTHVVICGGGPAGCELAAELAIAHNVKGGGAFTVSLLDAAPRLMTMWSEKVSRVAVKRLQRLGVSVSLNWMVSAVQPGLLTNKENETLQADLIIWTGGVTASPLVEKLGLQLTQKHQIPVESTLQSPEDASIFALGDSAQIPVAFSAHGDTTSTDIATPALEYAPQTAYEAVEQGRVVAWNVFQTAVGGHLRPYKSVFRGAVVTLGAKYGILVLPKQIVISGRVGYWARKMIDLNHFQKILPFMQACSFWYTGMRLMNKNNNPK